MNKTDLAFTVIVAVLAMATLSGCSSIPGEPGKISILYPVEGNNCGDFVSRKWSKGDRLAFGKFTPDPDVMHIWLERDGVCYDNMNKSGFDCDDPRYVEWKVVDANDPELFKLIYAKRG